MPFSLSQNWSKFAINNLANSVALFSQAIFEPQLFLGSNISESISFNSVGTSKLKIGILVVSTLSISSFKILSIIARVFLEVKEFL